MADFLTPLVDFTQKHITNTLGSAAFLTVLLLFFGAIVLNIVRQLLSGISSHPPEVFHIVPFIGSAIPYGKDQLQFLLQCREKYGDVFTFTLLGRKITAVLGAKGNNFVLRDTHAPFSVEEAYKRFTMPFFGRDVVYDVPEEVFTEQKKFVKLGFSLENFRLYVGMIEDEVQCFLKNDPGFFNYQINDVKTWGRFDAKNVMDQMMILTASRTVQPEVREHFDKSFSKLFNDLDGSFTPLNFLLPHLPLECNRKRDEAQKKLSEFYMNIIRKRRQSGEEAKDMISVLMSQKYRDGKPLPDHVIANLMIAILVASYLTISSAGCWTLLRLAQNPRIQQELYQEQVRNFGEPDGSFRNMTYEKLRDLPVLDSVIRETLRLHPSIHTVMRYVTDNVPIPATVAAPSEGGTYIIPRGHHIIACPVITQVDPQLWSESRSWDPTRWSDPKGFATRVSGCSGQCSEQVDDESVMTNKISNDPFLPFGAGRHRCIGEQFGCLQLKAVFATLIRQLEFKLDQPLPKENFQSVVTLPEKPRDVCYRRRNLDN